ncbi:hypothetical protein QWJ26_34210 [Streptomyces sp. CSDS2]|uniref:hypothetical protein n=1 Tax=Streptomyces sp. CSDS2 TaxID=3055051 RepID=UPI0025AEE173|nr:hypothetical protein [Streptomyces sp. CSDS2]MDN3264768.1 hypothetical protein [Streptomyces sp. CSDS2]
MRDLPVRRLASTALCASVLVGVTGPAAVAADTAREHGHTATQVSVPAAQKERLLARARALGSLNPALNPVVELLHQSLEKGDLPVGEAARLGAAAKAALAGVAAGPAPITMVKPATTPASTASASPTAPVAPTALRAARHAHHAVPVARDIFDDVFSALETAIDNLVEAITGDSDQLLQSATDVMSGLEKLLEADVTGSGTSAPSVVFLPAPSALPSE